MSERIELSLQICECCGDPIMILRGGYLRPEELDSLGLRIIPERHKFESIFPEPDMRAHEFQDPAQARVKYAEHLEGLPPHYEKALGVLIRKSQGNDLIEEVIVEVTACVDCEKFIAIADKELRCYEAAGLNLIPATGHVPYLPGVDMPPTPYQYEFIIEDECKDSPYPDLHGAVVYLQAHDNKDNEDKRLRITRWLKGQEYQVEWLPYDYYRLESESGDAGKESN